MLSVMQRGSWSIHIQDNSQGNHQDSNSQENSQQDNQCSEHIICTNLKFLF